VAIREVERLGGGVFTSPRGPAWFRKFVGQGRMIGVDDIESVYFRPDKETFYKRWGGITLSGSSPWTSGPTVDDATLACITGLPNLKRLDLNFTNVSDAGMEYVSRLRQLESLDLDGTDVSEASIDRLAMMPKLKKLTLDGRRISKSGSARLAAALPKCDIDRVDYFWLQTE
jgi:hypothetical protein